MMAWEYRKQRGYPRREDWEEGRCLGPTDLAELQDGDRVSVTWGGGNGPHVYAVKRSAYGILAGSRTIPEGCEAVLYTAIGTDEPHALVVWVERA